MIKQTRRCVLFLVMFGIVLAHADYFLAAETLRWVDEETGQKLFDIDDVVRFDWDKQIFELTKQSAMDFMAELGSLGVHGRKFILKDGQVIIYKGTLVTPASSIACLGPVIRNPILPDDINTTAPHDYELS